MGVLGAILLGLDIVVFVGSIVGQVVLSQQANRATDAPTRMQAETRAQRLMKASTTIVIVLTVAFVVDMLAIGL